MNALVYFNICGLLSLLFLPLSLHGKVDAEPSQALLELLDFLSISHQSDYESIVEATQKAWIREAGKERWEIGDSWSSHKEPLYPYLQQMHLFEPVCPQKNTYQAAVIFGSGFTSVEERMQYLLEQWNRGIQFHEIILLSGDRQLSNYEKEKMPREPKHQSEAEMMQYLWKSLSSSINELSQVPVRVIKTFKQKDENGNYQRPNTLDTVVELKKILPDKISLLFVSSQPHVQYQNAIVQSFGHSEWEFETIGKGIEKEDYLNGNSSIAVCLDAIARTLYVLYHKHS